REHRGKSVALLFFDVRKTREIFFRGFQGGVNSIKRQINEPRFLFVFFNELHRLVAEGFGGVADVVHLVRAAQNRVVRIAGSIEIIMCSTEKTEVFVEAALKRMELRFVAEVRLAKPAGRITRTFKPVTDGRLLERKAEHHGGLLCRAGIKFMTE